MTASVLARFFRQLERIDRRFIYLFVALSISIPLMIDWSLPPAEMKTADDFYQAIAATDGGRKPFVLVSLDWGPSTQAENRSQSAAVIEHLMRRRIPFGVITIYQYATPFLQSVPQEAAEKLMREDPSQQWTYGKDWVNFGFKPAGAIMIQGLARAADIRATLKADAAGTALTSIPCLSEVRTIRDISGLVQITGLVGTLNAWIQFFQTSDYRPALLHGCTSISIPEAYIYYSSGQLRGLLEGIAGAAWYEQLLQRDYPQRKTGLTLRINTGLAIAHLLIIGLILLGNIGAFAARFGQPSQEARP